MTLSNSDLFLVNRGGTDYSVSFDKVFADIESGIIVGDGKITLTEADGTPVGEFTVNQAGDVEIALPQVVIPESLHPKGFINVALPAPADPEHGDIYIQSSGGAGAVTADATFSPGIGGEVEEGVFVIYGVDDKWHAGGQANPTTVQSDWAELDQTSDAYIKNKPDLQAEIDDKAGDGAIQVEAGAGLIATGQNATANQKGDTTRTIAAVVGDGITIDGSGGIAIDPSFNLDGNVTRPNDGTLTIKDSDGNAVGTFTADQAGDTEVSLPKGFDGDYNSLDNKPLINDGKLLVRYADGSEAVTFSANQDADEILTLPAAATVNDGKLNLQDPTGTTQAVFSANQAGDQNVAVYIKDNYIQHLPVLS
jgi:hypothetical protein